MPTRVRYPDHNDDLAAAMAWLEDHAKQYGLDVGRTVLMGHSAGAFLVALQATDTTFAVDAGLRDTDVRCTIPLDGGGFDIAAAVAGPGGGATMFRNAFGDDPVVWAAASPLLQVTAAESIGPFLIVTRGSAQREADARALADVLVAAGGEAQVLVADPYSHAQVNDAIGRPDDQVVTPALTRFVQTCMEG